MKAVFISYNQALSELVMTIVERNGLRGFTQWENVMGKGSQSGEPHLGTHTWPSKNSALLVMMPDEKVSPLLEKLRELDSQTSQQGLRAFVWNIEEGI